MSNPNFQFSTAVRQKCKASILIQGLSGKGKSGLALILAYYLAKRDWTKVYDIDTENKSVPLYVGLSNPAGLKYDGFKVADFTPDVGYKPSNYQAFSDAAAEAGAEVVIKDSISHAWTYEGGILDILADKKKNNTRYQKDSYAAWGDEEVVAEKQKLMQLFRDHRHHVISTVRVKEKMEYGTDANGKTTLVSLGEQQIMQADVKYEPDLVLDMVAPGSASAFPKAKVIKSRYAIFEVDEVYEFTPQLCEQLVAYLEEGADPEELLEQQRVEYAAGVKQYLDAHPNAVPVWNKLKEDEGCKDIKLDAMPLDKLKKIFVMLTLD